MAKEATELFGSRGFKLRKWVANCHAKNTLLGISYCDLAPGVGEIDLGSQPLPDSKALGLIWDTNEDKRLVHCREFTWAFTSECRVSLPVNLIL